MHGADVVPDFLGVGLVARFPHGGAEASARLKVDEGVILGEYVKFISIAAKDDPGDGETLGLADLFVGIAPSFKAARKSVTLPGFTLYTAAVAYALGAYCGAVVQVKSSSTLLILLAVAPPTLLRREARA